jgi:hypothetical protein
MLEKYKVKLLKEEISESEKELKELFLSEKDLRKRERLQLLYLLKSDSVESITHAGKILGKYHQALRFWCNKYREGGLNRLLERETSDGRPAAIQGEALEKLKQELSKESGFKSYYAIQKWIKENLGIEMPYKTVFSLCHDKLGAGPKVCRPLNPKQNKENFESFKKTSGK